MEINANTMNSIHWFRKGLRIHDNPALIAACQGSRSKILRENSVNPLELSSNKLNHNKNIQNVYPVFIIDPYFAKPHIVGVNRYSFLLQSLADLDNSLRQIGSRLFVVKGKPEEELPRLASQWNIDLITFESDTEPYARRRDSQIRSFFSTNEINGKLVQVESYSSHTLFSPEVYIQLSRGNFPTTYQSFLKLFQACGDVRRPLPPITSAEIASTSEVDRVDDRYNVPTLSDMNYLESPTTPFRGGESEALSRLEEVVLRRPNWVASFEKPNTSPNSLDPSTTVLSPYLKFGCKSLRHVEGSR